METEMSDAVVSVLDYGYVRLVRVMGDDLAIVRAARVSHNAEPRHNGDDEKLIRYMMENRHTSPFEHVVFTFEVQAPLFVFRQWQRHRTWSYNELSARYTEMPDLFYVPEPHHVTAQHATNKQAREEPGDTRTAAEESERISSAIARACMVAYADYKYLLQLGCPRELARAVLPVSIYSRMFATVDLWNLFHFLRLRLHQHAQWEIRQYAQAMLQLVRQHVPVSCAAFEDTMQ